MGHLVDTLQLQFEDQIIMNGWMALTIFLFSFLFGGISAFMLSKIKQEITAWNQKKEERNDAGNDEESQTNYQLMEDEATVLRFSIGFAPDLMQFVLISSKINKYCRMTNLLISSKFTFFTICIEMMHFQYFPC